MTDQHSLSSETDLATTAERLGQKWADEAMQLIDSGEYGTALLLAVLVQFARAVLEDLPVEVRGGFIRAVATPGINAEAACEDARQ